MHDGCAALPNEKNRYASIVLTADKTQIRFQTVEPCVDDCITVEIIEQIHKPKNRLCVILLASK